MAVSPPGTALDAARHDHTTIALHWLTALLVIVQFALAETWDFFPRPDRHLMIVGHMSFGIVLTLVILLRLLWRNQSGRRLFETGSDLFDRLAKGMHYLLYVLLGAEIVLGFLTRWTGNQAISFFGLLIPSPFGHFSRATGDAVDEIHDLNAWLIMILAGGHALAALYHHYLLRDGVLRRMLPWGKRA